MTNTQTCHAMNALYEVTKTMTVEDLRRAAELAEAEQAGEKRRILVYCINETIRRKNKGIWK